MRRTTVGVFCALAAASADWEAHSARAAILGGGVTGGSSGGAFEQLDPPPLAAGPDAFQSPNLIAFDEQQNVSFATDVTVGPALTIPAGSVLSSHYVVFDPEVGSTMDGFVLFDEPIVAVLGGQGPLSNSAPIFGAAGTAYSVSGAIGPDPNDDIGIDPIDPSRLNFMAGAISPGDHVRVLTGALVPAPAAASMLLCGIAFTFMASGRL